MRRLSKLYKPLSILWLSIPVVLVWATLGISEHLIRKTQEETEFHAEADTIEPNFSVLVGFNFQYASLNLGMDIRYTLDDNSTEFHVYNQHHILEVANKNNMIFQVHSSNAEPMVLEKLESEESVYPLIGYCQINLSQNKEIIITPTSIRAK